jgi:1,4-alpha-glucan branching enzyme
LSREIISGEEAIVEKIAKAMDKVVRRKTREIAAVNIEFRRDSASSVFVVGDFNDWSASDDAKLENDNGVWRRRFNLKPGTYKYRLIVDGKWQEDPGNPDAERNPFGELDSILKVGE